MMSESDAFNQDIDEWDVSSVTNMERMFNFAELFNQNIGRKYNMYVMSKVTSFNQDLSSWNMSLEIHGIRVLSLIKISVIGM